MIAEKGAAMVKDTAAKTGGAGLAAAAYRQEISPSQFDCLILRQQCGVLQGLVDISRLEIGVVGEDLIAGAACSEQPKQPRHREPEPPDARLSSANAGINRYSSE